MKKYMHIHVGSYLAHFFLKRELFQTKTVEKIKTHISINSNQHMHISVFIKNTLKVYLKFL